MHSTAIPRWYGVGTNGVADSYSLRNPMPDIARSLALPSTQTPPPERCEGPGFPVPGAVTVDPASARSTFLRLAELLGHPCPRSATATQRRDSGSPPGFSVGTPQIRCDIHIANRGRKPTPGSRVHVTGRAKQEVLPAGSMDGFTPARNVNTISRFKPLCARARSGALPRCSAARCHSPPRVELACRRL